MTTRIGVAGVTGRMGRMLLAAIAESPFELTGAVARPGDPWVGRDAWGLAEGSPVAPSVLVTDDLSRVVGDLDVLIDFTTPVATLANAALCAEEGVAMVVGTTGFSEAQWVEFVSHQHRIPMCWAANFSTGVNVLFDLLGRAARLLGPDSDIEIIETHHRHKVDAPSGTALAMGETIARATSRKLSEVAVYGRQGQIGARDRSTIGFSTIRGGDVVGDHTVLFAADGERVEITHKASSRLAFARGALRAATWVATRAPGLYDMQDVLALRETKG